MPKVSTFLMFQGDAGPALDLYTDVFPDFEVQSVQKYDDADPKMPGQIESAAILFQGQNIRLFDSPPVHDFTFTPSISFFIDFDDEITLDGAFAKLSDGGQVMMPLDNHGFSRKFGWLADRFGVSWQLNLP